MRRPGRSDPSLNVNGFHINGRSGTMAIVAGTPRAAARPAAADAATRRRAPVQSRSRQRMERILDVTAALVDELGPGAVTTTLIAARAGISVGSIYAYFGDRAAIFDAIVTRSIGKHAELSVRIREEHRDLDWLDATGLVIDALVDLYRTEPGFRALWFSDHVSAEMRDAMWRSDEALAARLPALLAAGGLELDTPRPLDVARLHVGIIDKGMELAFRVDAAGDADVIAETKRAVRHYLGPYLRPLGRR